MGPKKKKSPTKEEIEARAREEEEIRLRAEEEARQERARERKAAADRKRLENEERIQRKAQTEEIEQIVYNIRQQFRNFHDARRKKAKWDRYMRCDGSPDPTIPGEINTYLNLWREDQERVDIDAVLKDSELALSLIAELEHILVDTPADEIMENEINRYRTTINEIEVLLDAKLQRAVHEVLLNATEMQDSETSNLQQVFKNDTVTLCVWGNLSKNPRIKNFEFKEAGISFDIPKILTLSDIAIVALFTTFDHYSHNCKSFFPRQKPPPEADDPVVVEEPVVEEQKTEGEGEEEEKKEGSELGDTLEREETEDVMAALKNLDNAEAEKEEEEEQEPEVELIEEEEVKTPEPPEWEEFDEDEDVIDLRGFNTLGGILHFNLYHMPPQPKDANDWIIRQVTVPPKSEPFEYMADSAQPGAASTVAGSESMSEKDDKKKDDKPPIKVSLTLPAGVNFSEEPTPARWDSESQHWSTNGFTVTEFKQDDRILNFRTSYFGTICLLQDTAVDMPFQSWEVRPLGKNNCKLTIIGASNEVEIEIKDAMCVLVSPNENEQLKHLIDNWMIPRDFIKAMKAAGLNLFPAADATKYVTTQNKNVISESRLYLNMALTASAIAYSWSKWNSEVDESDKIIVQATEWLKEEPLSEDDWSLYLVQKKRTMPLKMKEFDQSFSDEYIEDAKFNADMYHLMVDQASPEAVARIKESNFEFVTAVEELISATKMVTFS